jgi:hypothetical protein
VQNAGNNIPLSKQVKYFHLTKVAMEAKLGSGVVNDRLAKSFFLLGIGSNDLYQFVLGQQAKNKSATQSDATAFYDILMSNYSAAITVTKITAFVRIYFLQISETVNPF